MVKKIVQYPTTPSLEFAGNVRHFDEKLFELIQDLKDTIDANDLNALAAFQIGSPYAVIVIKQDDGKFLEIINPRIIKREGNIQVTETTAYFPNLSAKTTRYKKIKLMYEDRDENQKFLDADDDLSVTIQRKIDYVFGSNFRVRLDKDEQKLFDSKLEFGTDAITENGCPTVFKRDRILHTLQYILAGSFIALLLKFFISDKHEIILKIVENYSMITVFLLIVIYFFYAQYEGKQYKNCSSCQIGNIIGVSFIALAKLLVLFLANYFLLW